MAAPVSRSPALPPAAARLFQAQRELAAGRAEATRSLVQEALADPVLRADALATLAVAELMASRLDEALRHAEQAVELRPDEPQFQFTLGRVLKASGHLEGAEAAYRRALALRPDFAEAMVSLGIVLRSSGRLEEALALYDRAIAVAPALASAHANRANVLSLLAWRELEAGVDEAPSEEVLRDAAEAATLEPRNALVHRNLGTLLMRARRRPEAAQALNQALTLDPTDVDACLKLGACIRALGDNKLARELYAKWLQLNPRNSTVMQLLAALLTREGKADEGRQWAEEAAAMDNDPHSLLQLGSALMQSRRMQEAIAACERAVARDPAKAGLYPTYLLGVNYLHEDAKPIFAAHRAFGEVLGRPPRPPLRARGEGDRLRVGYVSGDFVRHSVSYFIGGLLEHHDKSRFEVTCYNNLAWGDAVSERLKSYGHRWVDCEGLSDEAFRRLVQADGIDVLVDLAGHTSHSRVMAFAKGLAPVQLGFLGYPTVSGVPAVDFRVTDLVIDPGDLAHDLPGDQPLPLARSMFCYRPDEAPPIDPQPPVQRTGHITFGSFNNIAKVTDTTLAMWAGAMRALPGSQLLLKSSSMAQEGNRRNIEQFMAARGVDPGRLRLQPWLDSKAGHLALYNEVDIALDPYPYNGATTTCEALWMGVPVVSRRGATHTARMGASILTAAGRAGWCADDEEGFVQTALRLACDPPALVAWRREAREALKSSELFDAPGFTAAFESVLLEAWSRVRQHS